ncbi:hypothetical protein [Streptomyces niger]
MHQPFTDQIWRHIQSEVEQRADREQHEADLADALDQLLRRTRDAERTAPSTRRRRNNRITRPGQAPVLPGLADVPRPRQPAGTDVLGAQAAPAGPVHTTDPSSQRPSLDEAPAWSGERGESLEELSAEGEQPPGEDLTAPDAGAGGYGLWDAEAEAEQW